MTAELEYQIVRSRRRSLELRVYPDRRIEVRAPQRCPVRDIYAFVAQRRDWLTQKLESFAQMPLEPEAAQRFADGSEHPFLGQRIRLVLSQGRGTAALKEGVLMLSVQNPADPASVERALQRWYRQQALEDFSERVQRLFQVFAQGSLFAQGHYRLPEMCVRNMRSRWGSLSVKSGMTLNLELIKTEPDSIDYVVLHELCHLVHRNHGAGFKALMSELMPDWPARRQRLNQTLLF